MSFGLWQKTVYVTLTASILMTIFCLTPGPGLALANSKVYITFVSHIALLFGALGVIAGFRVEQHIRDDVDSPG